MAAASRDPQLVAGERILWQMKPHWIILVAPIVWAVTSTALLIAILSGLNNIAPDRSAAPFVDWVLWGVYLFILVRYTAKGFVDWFTTRYVFTNQRVITRNGLIVISGETIPLDKVHSIQFKKTLLERVFGSGSLTIESAADNQAIIKHVTHAEEVHGDLYAEIAHRSVVERRESGPIDFS